MLILLQAAPPSAPWFALFLVFFVVMLVFGTILGWVAAGRIRRSEGQLYGLRLAAFAGLFFPALLALITPLVVATAVARSLSATTQASGPFLAIAALVSLAFVSVRLFQAARRNILGKGEIRELFGRKKNRVPLILISLLWIGVGCVIFLQRPRQVDEVVKSESENQLYQATASTWEQRQVFGAKRAFYRFEIAGRGGTVNRSWDVLIPTAELAKSHSASPIAHYWFEKEGSIQWHEPNREVEFIVDGVVVFEASLSSLQGEGHMSFPSGNLRSDFGGLPHLETLPAE